MVLSSLQKFTTFCDIFSVIWYGFFYWSVLVMEHLNCYVITLNKYQQISSLKTDPGTYTGWYLQSQGGGIVRYSGSLSTTNTVTSNPGFMGGVKGTLGTRAREIGTRQIYKTPQKAKPLKEL